MRQVAINAINTLWCEWLRKERLIGKDIDLALFHIDMKTVGSHGHTGPITIHVVIVEIVLDSVGKQCVLGLCKGGQTKDRNDDS